MLVNTQQTRAIGHVELNCKLKSEVIFYRVKGDREHGVASGC